ncbi:hypothetical protein AURDEDRAFT_159180 [Auricularia subglabra TFB-10046 SS5]|nr:hypothetical protein AURDEDRAFT_159180 [Auricularia subglabra TFB-10046 SS5]
MRCEVCSEPGVKRCASCQSVRYCSQKCQQAHWAEHKFTCRPDKITDADQLVHAVLKGSMPTHPDVQLAFGFMEIDTLDGGGEVQDLIQFWRHLVVDRKVTAKTLNTWQKRRVVSASVLQAVSDGPWTAERIFWRQWIARRHERLWPAAQYSWANPPTGAQDMLQAAFDFMRARTPSLAQSTLPEFLGANRIGSRRFMCFLLYRCVRSTMTPVPGDFLYLAFGYVTCPFEKQSSAIELAYMRLLELCTFDELAAAVETSGVYALLRRHGLTKALPRPLELEDVLSRAPARFKDVWHLKRHIDHTSFPDEQAANGHLYSPDRPALARFGFGSVEPEDEKFLERVYRSVLVNHSARPLELQAAMERGGTFAHVSGLDYFKIPKSDRARFRRLTAKSSA